VLKEHTFKLPSGNSKPDIVATKRDADGCKSVILDSQIVSANGIEGWHRAKLAKYNRADLKNEIRSLNQTASV